MAQDADGALQIPLASEYNASCPSAQSIISSRPDSRDSKEKNDSLSHKKEPLLAAWWFEILSVCFSITCMLCMIALLGSIHGRPYEPWHAFHASITPNALLAILSTFSKSSLLLSVAQALGQLKWTYFQQRAHCLFDLQVFDEASRGPLGALKLVRTVRAQAVVASIGAIIVVLAMAMDPFAQQILSFPTATTNLTNSTAHIGSAQGFGLILQDWDQKKAIRHYNLQLQDAVTFGILSGDSNPTGFNCSTGDCRWPAFQTLGVCSKCLDVSSQLEVECRRSTHDSGSEHVNDCIYTFPEAEGAIQYYTGQPDSRFTPKFRWGADKHGNLSSWKSENKSINIIGYSTKIQNKVTTALELPLIAVMEQARWPSLYSKYSASVFTWEHMGRTAMPHALQCYLSWCEQTHETTEVRGNVLHDEATSTANLQVGIEHGFKHWAAYDNFTPLWPVNRPHPPNSSLNAFKPSNEAGDVYWIASGASFDLSYCIGHALGRGTSQMNNDADWSYYQNSAISNRIYYGNLTLILDQIATSLTSTLRNLNHTHTICGTEIQAVTHVRVNWYWLIYPATLVILAASFLMTSIAFSTERGGIVWKTSVLPLVLGSANEHERDDVDASGLKNLETTARVTQARLVVRNEGSATLQYHSSDANGA